MSNNNHLIYPATQLPKNYSPHHSISSPINLSLILTLIIISLHFIAEIFYAQTAFVFFSNVFRLKFRPPHDSLYSIITVYPRSRRRGLNWHHLIIPNYYSSNRTCWGWAA